MASEVKIQAESRTEFGKGAARRIRRADKVPAVLYGHGTDPVHITLPGHDLMLALKTANALLSIELDGDSQLALPKQVQRDLWRLSQWEQARMRTQGRSTGAGSVSAP